MEVNMKKSAIVLVEFQNQWTERGLYHRLIKGQLESRRVLENTRVLVREARKNGIKIIHAPLVIDPERKRGWLARMTLGRVFTKNTWKSEFTEGIYEEGDIVVEGRYAFDAFTGSNLEQLLRDNQVESVFLCGFTTDQCVAKTMKTALSKGFSAFLVSDCTATLNGFFQRKTENSFQGKVTTSQELLASIEQLIQVGRQAP